MTEEKSKFELTIDYIMIVGKYFKTNLDYINIMKVCKKYQELVLMYHFNPISDIVLFKNMQTQHFYDKEDINKKKYGMFQYIYWYKIGYKFTLNNNGIFKNIELNYGDIEIINGNCIVPEGITKINEDCFYNCTNLINIKLPNSLKVIDDYAFCNCGLKSIDIPYGCTLIGNFCFNNCLFLKEINLPKSIKFIGIYAFSNTLIKNLNYNSNFELTNSNYLEYFIDIRKKFITENTNNDNVIIDISNLNEEDYY